MNDLAQAIAALPAQAAQMLAVDILLADPEALADDVLESCLYLLRDKLREATDPDKAQARQGKETHASSPTENLATNTDAHERILR